MFTLFLLQAQNSLSRISCDGFCAPRWQHHLFYVGLSLGAAGVLYLLTRKPLLSGWVATIGVGIMPHVVATFDRESDVYPINRMDWACDAVVRSAPLVVAYAVVSDTSGKATVHAVKPMHLIRNAAVYGAGYALIAPKHCSP